MSRWFANKRRKLCLLTLGILAVTLLLYLWLPFRVAVVQLVLRLGGDGMMIASKYKPLDSPRYVPVARAQEYSPDTEVLGFEINGVAKAIPVKRIAWHLVVNDEIGGESVVVTLCTVGDAAFAYRAKCGEQSLSFAPVGLARNNLVIEDAQTGSRWQQFTGKAIGGSLAGSQLIPIPLERVRLKDWRRRHPSGSILEPGRNERDNTVPNDNCPVMCYYPSERFLLQPPRHEDDRLPRKRPVVGMILTDGEAVACASPEQVNPAEVPSVLKVKCYWSAWVEFHPGSRLLGSLGEGKTSSSESDNLLERRVR
jgi:hypothetical protein